MKFISTFVCWMAAVALVQADPADDIRVQKAKQAQQPQVASKAHVNPNARFYGKPNVARRQFPGNLGLKSQAGINPNLNQRFSGPRHFNVANTPNPKIASVKFNPQNHIVGSEKWQGQHYSAFRNYHAQWHDRDWWRHHHNRIILIGGGWYFWDTGFWYPAWGYDSTYAYYPYDGPIYAYNDLPPDQVIANVQASLQAQGYYSGEIDGLLGPLTRAALADYQRDHGLYTTAAIDQPTLDSLGMG